MTSQKILFRHHSHSQPHPLKTETAKLREKGEWLKEKHSNTAISNLWLRFTDEIPHKIGKPAHQMNFAKRAAAPTDARHGWFKFGPRTSPSDMKNSRLRV
jgi:hypothetical protein